ncbi:MAG: hypothetical protein HW421_4153 [Ignavibacteria bacterium]|nr:hypothetical protein [Ignavibacteria bacterium]
MSIAKCLRIKKSNSATIYLEIYHAITLKIKITKDFLVIPLSNINTISQNVPANNLSFVGKLASRGLASQGQALRS